MNYLLLVLFLYFFSCSSNKDKNLVDIDYYMKQGKEISLNKELKFEEITKINNLTLSKPISLNNWLSYKLNSSNYLPRFSIDDFKKKFSLNINAKSFLVISKNIYLIDDYSNLIVLDENLKELKKKSIYKKKEFDDYILDFSMTSDGKSIYTSDNLGNVHCIEIENLNTKWSLKLGTPVNSNLYLYNGDLFFINSNNKLFSVKSSNGQIIWSYENPSKLSKEKYKISISNNLLIANNDYGEIYSYDLLKKIILWKISLKDQEYKTKLKNFIAGYPVINNGILYFSSNFGELITIDQYSGRILWKRSISSTNLPIINNYYIFLINQDGFFYVLNKKNGEIIFSKNLSIFYNNNKMKKKIIFRDMVLANDYIYFINSGTNLIKLNINDFKIIKSENFYLENSTSFFVLNDNLYIIENKKLTKFFN